MADNDDVVIDLKANDDSLTSTMDDATKVVAEAATEMQQSFENVEFGSALENQLMAITSALEQMSGGLKQNEHSVQDFDQAEDEANDTTGSLLDTFSKVGNVLSGIKNAYDMVSGAISTALDKFNEWIDAAGESELQEVRLREVRRASGDAVGYTADQLIRLSENLQEVTRFEAETAQQAQSALLAFKNIRGDIFSDAVTGAADLAEAMGQDLVGATRLLGRALQEPGEGLMALRRSGITFTDSEHEMIKAMTESGKVMEAQRLILDKVKATFGGVAEAIGDTHVGKWERFNNKLGDVWESLGMLLIPVMDASIPLLEKLVTAGKNLVPVFEQIVAGATAAGTVLMEYLQPTFEWLVGVLIGTTAAIETMVMKWEEVFTLIGSSIAYEVVKMYNVVEYYLKDVMIGLLDWFATNWFEIFQDLNNAQQRILINMGKNIWDFVTYVKDVLSGNGGEFKFTALLDGFESTIQELPKIAARVEGEMEQMLREDRDKAADNLNEDFNQRYERNKKFLEDLFVKKDKEKLDMKANPGKDFNVDGPKEEKEKKDEKKNEKKDEEGDVRFEGIVELSRRIEQSKGRGPEDKVVDAVKEAAKDIVDGIEGAGMDGSKSIGHEMQEANDAIDKLNNDLSEELEGNFDELNRDMMNILEESEKKSRESILEAVDAIIEADEKQSRRDAKITDLMLEIKNASGTTAEATTKISESALPAHYG